MLNHVTGFTREDYERYSVGTQDFCRKPVLSAADDRFSSVRVNPNSIICEDAIEIGDDRLYFHS